MGSRRNKTQSTKDYTPSLHAIDRARHRLGVNSTEAMRWFDEAVRKATYITAQNNRGRSQLIYEYKDVRLVVDPDARKIVTIYPIFDTSFLTPIFERERRKIKREVTRNVRKLEAEQAKLFIKYGESAMNRARAKNPNTRKLIKERMGEYKTQIDEVVTAIKREEDRLVKFERAVEVMK